MTINKKFQIDTTIIECLNKKNIDFRTILKNTIQFILMIENELKHETEQTLLEIIYEYSDYTTNKLSHKYIIRSSFFTKEQDRVYNLISRNNRIYILNELISIAINNNNYYNIIEEDIIISKDNIINNSTLNFFLAFKKEEKIYIEIIIGIMEALLFKHERVFEKNLFVDSYYKELLLIIFKKNYLNSIEPLLNYNVGKFLYEELGKIYFFMNIEYNMSLKNKSKNFRKWKSKYEKILINKYNNNIDDFKKNEIIVEENLSLREQKDEFYGFLNSMLAYTKEQVLLLILYEKYDPKYYSIIKRNLERKKREYKNSVSIIIF
jgi:hypothetical protein